MLTRGGRYNESNYPAQELGAKKGGGHIFEGGVLAGHYGITEWVLATKFRSVSADICCPI